MSDSSFHLAIPRKIVLAIFLCNVATVSAQPAPPPTPSPAPATSEDAETVKQGSNSSFALVRRQAIIQCVEIARDAIGRSDYLTALPLMERILSESNSFVPSGSSSEVSSHEEVSRLMRQLPAGMRQRLDEQRRTLALRAWDQARSNGIAEVTGFIQQFGDLPLAIDAWWWVGCHERDHARNRLAAAAFGRMAEHRHASKQQRAIALVAGAESLIWKPVNSGKRLLFSERLMELDSNLVIGIGGRTVTLGQWLARTSHRSRVRVPVESID